MAPHQRQRARAEHTGQAQVEEGFVEALKAADGRSGDQDHLRGRPGSHRRQPLQGPPLGQCYRATT